MSSLTELLAGQCPTIQVVDVGALPITGQEEAYLPLLKRGVASVVGFDPTPGACDRLACEHGPNHRFLPYFIGDGRQRPFYVCRHPEHSSLYEPNRDLAHLFQEFAEEFYAVQQITVDTRRLDDIEAITGIDFLKIDVQGGELDVLRGAERLLADTLVVQCEVEFVPLYRDQPLFADVDAHLRAHGFMFHRLLGYGSRMIKPLIDKLGRSGPGSQWLWADVVYIKDLNDLARFDAEQLLKLAVVMFDCYAALDLVMHVLTLYDQKTGTDLGARYFQALRGAA